MNKSVRKAIVAQPSLAFELISTLDSAAVFQAADKANGFELLARLAETCKRETLPLTLDSVELVINQQIPPEQGARLIAGKNGTWHPSWLVKHALGAKGTEGAPGFLANVISFDLAEDAIQCVAAFSDPFRFLAAIPVLQSHGNMNSVSQRILDSAESDELYELLQDDLPRKGLTTSQAQVIFGDDYEESREVLKTKTKVVRTYWGSSLTSNRDAVALRLVFEKDALVSWQDGGPQVRRSPLLPRPRNDVKNLLLGWDMHRSLGALAMCWLALDASGQNMERETLRKTLNGDELKRLLAALGADDPSAPAFMDEHELTTLRSMSCGLVHDYEHDLMKRMGAVECVSDLLGLKAAVRKQPPASPSRSLGATLAEGVGLVISLFCLWCLYAAVSVLFFSKTPWPF